MRVVASSTLSIPLTKSLKALTLILSGAHRRFNHVSKYERLFAQAEGALWAHSTSMARVALWQSLKALNLKKGDSVLLSPVNIPEMLAVIQALGLKPVFVDFAEQSLFIDPEDLEQKIKASKARVFFLTYLAGQIGDLRRVHTVCREHGVTLIQDATQANQCRYLKKNLVEWADITFYSTCELKFVHTFRGAMLCGMSFEMEKRLLAVLSEVKRPASTVGLLQKWLLDCGAAFVLNPFWLGHVFHFFSSRIFFQNPLGDFKKPRRFFGSDYHRMKNGLPKSMVYRLSDFESILGMKDLKRMPPRITKHRRLADRYLLQLKNSGRLPVTSTEAESSYWRFPVIFSDTRQLREFERLCARHGVIPEKSGLSLLSRETSSKAHRIISHTRFLPCHCGLREKDFRRLSLLASQMEQL